MNHQPFETWLLADEPLAADERRSLQQHLQTCASCRSLQAAWEEVTHRFRRVPDPQPRPGFAARWQQRLEAHHRRMERRQALLLLAVNLGGMAAIVSLSLALLPAVFDSPLAWLIAVSTRLSVALTVFGTLGDVARILASFLPPAWWWGALQAGALLLALWVRSVQKFLLPGRVSS